ncbi:MAG: hypothetical protein JSU96_02045 [Acidobacteriota bacterium]|nr:MAG: hypothetical protein JSU96_02045 [Acidobacteriota bacterium]
MQRLIGSVVSVLLAISTLASPSRGASIGEDLEGSWELVVAQNQSPGGELQTWIPSQKARAIKILNDSRFTVITHSQDGTFSHANGGIYQSDLGTYHETIQFSSRPEWIGQEGKFESNLNDDLWHIKGEFGGTTLIETWRRVKSLRGLGGLPLGSLIAVREVTLREGRTAGDFENFVRTTFHPAMQRLEPDLQLVVMKGDRGVRSGQYLVVMNFKDVSTRDYYFETAEAEDYPIFQAALGADGKIYNQLFEFIESPTFTDYEVLGGQDAAAGVSAEMFGLHTLKVKAGKEQEFEELVLTKWASAWSQHVPGTKVLILKGERGENAGGYRMMFTLNPASLRDFYIPDSGTVTDIYNQAFEPTAPLWDEMAELAEVMLGKEGSSFTDYELIR